MGPAFMSSDISQRRIVNASLLRAIVNQFAERPRHLMSDIAQFEKLALGLIDIIDAETVANLTRPLCFHPETPASIFLRLYEKGGPCARLAFEYAPTLPQPDLLAVAEHGPANFALAIARRRDLDRDMICALATRNEHAILRALASNRAVHLDAASRRALMLAARDDVPLARILLERDDVEFDPEALFLGATRLERVAIILSACRRTLVAGKLERRPADPDFVARLALAALHKDRHLMAGLLADALDCRRDRARAILLDTLGEALALTLAALGVDIETATRILLCADPAISHDPDRVRSLRGLMRSTPQRAAMHIVAAITGSARMEKDTPRRATLREDAQSGPGWRRASPRGAETTARKFEQSA